MNDKLKTKNLIRNIFEFRYKPNPEVIDYRGSWAESIADYFGLSEWKIQPNRIDIYDLDKKNNLFVSYRNAGVIINMPDARINFRDLSVNFLKHLFQLTGFREDNEIHRIGVRTIFCKEYDGSFDDLFNKYSENFINLSEKAKKKLNCKIIDIGSPLTLQDDIAKIKFMGGPMESDQIADFFKDINEFPETGLFFDIDYSIEPNEILNEEKIEYYLREFIDRTWKKIDDCCKVVLGT